MPERPSVWTRAWNRARRVTTRARNRVRAVPVRVWCRRQGLPVPPSSLIHLVCNTDDVFWFLDSGSLAAWSLRQTVERHGIRLDDLGAILDFGCGVGRVMRYWQTLRGPALHGTDFNPKPIAWCRRHLPFAEFRVNPLSGPLDYPDATFDLIYALSVFTHLSEARQRTWIIELKRVLRPGGHLFLTLHGAFYREALAPEERSRFDAGHLVVRQDHREGRNDCATFHPEAYVHRVLARGFDVIDLVPKGALGNPWQDVVLLRKPA